MDEQDITKFCLIVSIIGLAIIYFADTNLSARSVSGAEISKEILGERVLLCGKITNVDTSEKGTFFLKLDDGTKTDVVLFQNRATEQNTKNIKDNENACITGTVAEYKNKIELIATKVTAS